MATRRKRRVGIFEADSHSGHVLGLCNPTTQLMRVDGPDLGVDLGVFQQYIWNLRTEYIGAALDIAGRSPIIHGHNGDITQGNKYKSQHMTDVMVDQFVIAEANLQPIYDRRQVTTGRIIAGTGAHTFGAGTAEIAVAKLLQLRYPKKDIRPLAHSLFEIDGIEFDVAHHGPGAGIRQWTRGNVARHYLRSKMWQEFKTRGRAPHVFLRGHYHTFVYETLREQYGGQYWESHLIVLPSWCGMTEFARQATQSEYEITNGLVVIEIIPDDQIPLRIHPFVRTLDLRTKEVL